jgi:hypothetical protein
MGCITSLDSGARVFLDLTGAFLLVTGNMFVDGETLVWLCHCLKMLKEIELCVFIIQFVGEEWDDVEILFRSVSTYMSFLSCEWSFSVV